MEDKPEISHVEDMSMEGKPRAAQTKLFSDDGIVLIPQPTVDPNDPLNLPSWRKWTVLALVSAYGCTAVVLASGMGAIFSMVQASYPGTGDRANDLLTLPTLLMGVGNLISMPLAMAIGRRPIFLASMLILVAGGLWCALSTSLDSHIAGRSIMSLAAGQSEALAPMIIQEIFFVHEKGRALGWFIFIQNGTCGAFFVMSTFLVAAYGWKWWYGLFTIINAVLFVLSFVFLTESSYAGRRDSAHSPETGRESYVDDEHDHKKPKRATTNCRPVLDLAIYAPRTWKGDMRLANKIQRWNILPTFYWQVLQSLCIPMIFWLLLLNGGFLGIYVFESATFAQILMAPPYGLSFQALGSVQAGQIVVCLIFLPLLGYGSDWVIQLMSRRNDGNYKPEYRLVVLIIPAIVGVVCAIVYGQIGAHPYSWGLSAPVITYNASLFAFIGANVVGITYAVDSFPLRAEAVLVVICAGRGIISFGLSYATIPSIAAIGYDGALNIQGGISGGLSLLAVFFYVVGPRIRVYANKLMGLE